MNQKRKNKKINKTKKKTKRGNEKQTPTLRQRGSDVTGHVSTVIYRYQPFDHNLASKNRYTQVDKGGNKWKKKMSGVWGRKLSVIIAQINSN